MQFGFVAGSNSLHCWITIKHMFLTNRAYSSKTVDIPHNFKANFRLVVLRAEKKFHGFNRDK